jgi:hypothetical protein
MDTDTPDAALTRIQEHIQGRLGEGDYRLQPRTLNPTQVHFLNVALDAGPGSSVKSLCEVAGISRQAYYDWRSRSPTFAEAYDRLWYVQLKDAMPGVTSALIAQAQAGNIKAAQLIYATMGLVINQSRSEQTIRVVVERE